MAVRQECKSVNHHVASGTEMIRHGEEYSENQGSDHTFQCEIQ